MNPHDLPTCLDCAEHETAAAEQRKRIDALEADVKYLVGQARAAEKRRLDAIAEEERAAERAMQASLESFAAVSRRFEMMRAAEESFAEAVARERDLRAEPDEPAGSTPSRLSAWRRLPGWMVRPVQGYGTPDSAAAADDTVTDEPALRVIGHDPARPNPTYALDFPSATTSDLHPYPHLENA